MFRFVRAAGFAAAIAVTGLTAAYAGPMPYTAAAPEQAVQLFVADSDLESPQPDQQPIAAPASEADAQSSPRPLAELVGDHASARTRDAEHECLAGAVYFEAKGEPLRGQLAVAEVILNRAGSGRFPASICGVVKQRGQFSFVRGGRFPPIARASAAWRKAVAVAHIAREELAEGAVPRALFFHATYVAPRWRGLTRIATVGNHIFYR
jgi:N-acetylmuramoyl-L-alanine amidase